MIWCYLFESYGIVSSSVPWKSMTDMAVWGMLSNPRNGDPDIGAIEAIVSLNAAAVVNQCTCF